jgi:hypothetical protein
MTSTWIFGSAPPRYVLPNLFAWPPPCLFFLVIGLPPWVFFQWYFRLHTFELTACIRGLGEIKTMQEYITYESELWSLFD